MYMNWLSIKTPKLYRVHGFTSELIGHPIDYKSELSKFKSLVITLTLSHHNKITWMLIHLSRNVALGGMHCLTCTIKKLNIKFSAIYNVESCLTESEIWHTAPAGQIAGSSHQAVLQWTLVYHCILFLFFVFWHSS